MVNICELPFFFQMLDRVWALAGSHKDVVTKPVHCFFSTVVYLILLIKYFCPKNCNLLHWKSHLLLSKNKHVKICSELGSLCVVVFTIWLLSTHKSTVISKLSTILTALCKKPPVGIHWVRELYVLWDDLY